MRESLITDAAASPATSQTSSDTGTGSTPSSGHKIHACRVFGFDGSTQVAATVRRVNAAALTVQNQVVSQLYITFLSLHLSSIYY